MKKIAVDQINNGDILAKEVCGPSGNVLLTKGVSLTTAIGRRLGNWEIEYVFVEGEGEEEHENSVPSVCPVALKNELMELFSNVLSNPVMKKIFAAAYQHRLGEKD